ncbi:ribosomal protein S8 [Nemania sp. FL0916]|nr:ribosomal protein S8 [Nemania sp. FL0916]
MVVSGIVNMTSHLQNACRAKLGLTSVPLRKYNMYFAVALQHAGLISFVTRGGMQPPDPATITTFEPPDLTSANVAKQRLWIGLKYMPDGTPVMREIKAISKSTRRVTMQLPDLSRLARGFDAQRQPGLKLGECIFVMTDRGCLEIREAVERKVGGLLLARAGP